MINLGRDRATNLLTVVVLNYDDTRDGYRPGSFQALLERACEIVGERSAIRAESKAKKILSLARTAAIQNGLRGVDRIAPAMAAQIALRPAFEGGAI